jgi:hypothetical protein
MGETSHAHQSNDGSGCFPLMAGSANQQVFAALTEQWLQNNRTSKSYGGDRYYNHSDDPYDDHL